MMTIRHKWIQLSMAVLSCVMTACEEDNPTSVVPDDMTPPGFVSNLAAGSPTDSSLTLNWSVNANALDISTIPSRYEIYYSTVLYDLLTEGGLLQSARRLEYVPQGPPSIYHGMTIRLKDTSGKGAEYFFVLRAADANDNWTGYSNIAHARTLDRVPRLVASWPLHAFIQWMDRSYISAHESGVKLVSWDSVFTYGSRSGRLDSWRWRLPDTDTSHFVRGFAADTGADSRVYILADSMYSFHNLMGMDRRQWQLPFAGFAKGFAVYGYPTTRIYFCTNGGVRVCDSRTGTQVDQWDADQIGGSGFGDCLTITKDYNGLARFLYMVGYEYAVRVRKLTLSGGLSAEYYLTPDIGGTNRIRRVAIDQYGEHLYVCVGRSPDDDLIQQFSLSGQFETEWRVDGEVDAMVVDREVIWVATTQELLLYNPYP